MSDHFNRCSLLLPGFGSDNGVVFTDFGPHGKVLDVKGHTKTVVAQSKYYGSSIYFDGSGDILSGGDYDSDFLFGAGDFTISFWIRTQLSGHSAWPGILQIGEDNTGGGLSIAAHSTLQPVQFQVDFHSGSAWVPLAVTGSATEGAWHHFALTRASGVVRAFLNGVKGMESTTPTGNNLTQSRLSIGGRSTTGIGGSGFRGWLQDVEILKGYARYTADFTPPAKRVGAVSNSNAAPVLDASGDPAEREIIVVPETAGIGSTRAFSAMSDASGEFEIQCPIYPSWVIAKDSTGTLNDLLLARVMPV